MSGHRARPSTRPRHLTRPVIWAPAAALIVLAASACTSTGTPGTAGAPVPPVTAISEHPGELTSDSTGSGRALCGNECSRRDERPGPWLLLFKVGRLRRRL